MSHILLAGLGFALAVLACRAVRGGWITEILERAEPRLRRFGPIAAAIISAAIVWWVWDQLVPVPVIQDESSYLLQAEIFARGRWTVPTPPLPEFFEQPHVQIAPAVASKYAPGHALLLSIGALMGFRGLVPLLLTAVTAALLFLLVARLSNAWVALLAWAFWTTAPIVLRFQPSYFSELTTTALVLASWWCLLSWRESRRRRWLLLLALAIGWGAMTRPLTMLAFAIPMGVVVIRDVVRQRRWRDFALAFAVGVMVLAILPLWSRQTTGSWRVSPLQQYRRDYMPFDQLGFVPDTSAPRRAASFSPVLVSMYDGFLAIHQEHELDALPAMIGLRVANLVGGFFRELRLPLLPFAIVGLFASGALQFAAASCLLFFAAYLPYAHPAGYTLYYLEMTPVVAALTALGVWRVALRLSGAERGARVSIVCVTFVLALTALRDIPLWRREHRWRGAFYREFAESIKRIPNQPAILFVQYSPRRDWHFAVVSPTADLSRARVWVVHDLGAHNAELLRRAPGRTPHYFDEAAVVERP